MIRLMKGSSMTNIDPFVTIYQKGFAREQKRQAEKPALHPERTVPTITSFPLPNKAADHDICIYLPHSFGRLCWSNGNQVRPAIFLWCR